MTLSFSIGKQALGIALAFIPGCGVMEAHSCTEIGCTDATSLRIERPDGARLAYDVTLLVDGQEVRCAKPVDAAASTQTCTDPNITIVHEELADCSETRSGDAVSQTCVPNGTFIQTIQIQGEPSRVDVTLVDGANSFTHRFEPTYTSVAPNGPDCDPICMQGSGEWVVE